MGLKKAIGELGCFVCEIGKTPCVQFMVYENFPPLRVCVELNFIKKAFTEM